MTTILTKCVRWRFGLITLASFLAGCGQNSGLSRAEVSGEVLLDEKPVPFASVQFIPIGAAKGPRATAQVTDGEFQLSSAEGPVFGELRVEIRTDYGRMHPGDGPEQLAKRYHGAPPEPIPAMYNRESVLKVTASPAQENKFSFRLKSSKQH
ncbi:MAG: hypothetical protein K8T91_12815 [Planctomycetes bacterium]|nr:hypothetical protein [Planctomycetota bacterium]